MITYNFINFKYGLVLLCALLGTSSIVISANPKVRMSKTQISNMVLNSLGGYDPHTRPGTATPPTPLMASASVPKSTGDQTPGTHPATAAADCTAPTCHSAPSEGLINKDPATQSVGSISTSGTVGTEKSVVPDNSSAFCAPAVGDLELK